jgi:hypothetical protein
MNSSEKNKLKIFRRNANCEVYNSHILGLLAYLGRSNNGFFIR